MVAPMVHGGLPNQPEQADPKQEVSHPDPTVKGAYFSKKDLNILDNYG
jgi:hypothetical protein